MFKNTKKILDSSINSFKEDTSALSQLNKKKDIKPVTHADAKKYALTSTAIFFAILIFSLVTHSYDSLFLDIPFLVISTGMSVCLIYKDAKK